MKYIKINRNARKFAKKTGYRILGKLIDLLVLFAIGYLLGLKLIRY